jgi:hypothetical protein
VTALNNKARTETDPTGAEESAKRYQLSTKLFAKNEVDVTLSERTLLLERIGALYGDVPLIYGRICDILEEKEPELPDEADEEPASQPPKSKADKGAATDGGK